MVNQPIGNHGVGIFCVVIFDLGPLLQGQMRIPCLLLQVWGGKPNYRKSSAKNLLVWSDLTLDPPFKVKRG